MSENPVDQRGKLDEEPFSYRELSGGRIFIYWNGKHVTTLQGKAADKLRARLTNADEKAVQLALAKVTGNFKRGNEHR
jgi:hypothetical protein